MPQNYGYALDPGFKPMLASIGIRHADVLRRAGLPEDLLNRPAARVTTEQYFSFLTAIEACADDPLLAVRLAEGMTGDSFAPPLFASLCSPNLTVAATRLAKFKPLIAPVQIDVESTDEALQISFWWPESPTGPPAFLVGSEALFLAKLARLGTRHRVNPIRVTMKDLPLERAAFEEFLGCRIHRGQQLSVRFSAQDAVRPFLTHNGAMWSIFEPQLRKRLADLEGAASYADRTRAVLVEALPAGQVSVDVVAKRLAVSPRTLQRRLHEEDTSFKDVMQSTRESLSRHYLTHTRLSASQIALLLGFEEPNSFFRAFQNWTGTTPALLRQAAQGGRAS